MEDILEGVWAAWIWPGTGNVEERGIATTVFTLPYAAAWLLR